MTKLVTKFRYYKPGGRKKIGGYAKYIALREGVEKCDDSKKYAPVLYNQKQLIQKILKDFPDSKERHRMQGKPSANPVLTNRVRKGANNV